jgi:tetratricopeptide (TPR) repeat protein
VIALLLAAALSAKPDAAAVFARGQALLERGDAAAASAQLEQAVALAPRRAGYHVWLARSYTAEAKQSVNAVRLAYLGWNIGTQLEEAVHLDPNDADARARLLQYYVTAPRVVGGNMRKARALARDTAKRDPALGAWANGYLAYRAKQLGAARKKFQEAVIAARDVPAQVLALTWLGWLSQESQTYEDAFAAWRRILAIDPTQTQALYEIGRTASFCHCNAAEGTAAIERYLAMKPRFDQPTVAEARKVLTAIR